jgi:hypothetical protein
MEKTRASACFWYCMIQSGKPILTRPDHASHTMKSYRTTAARHSSASAMA